MNGLAELTIQPLHNKLSSIKINCRQCKIIKTFVNDIPVEFTLSDPVLDLNLGPSTTIAHHQVYKSKYLNALREADEGEMSIQLPPDCIKQIGTRIVTQPTPQPQQRSQQQQQQQQQQKENEDKPPETEPVYAFLTVRIEYTLEDPRNGIVYVQKDDEIAPYRSNHMYTVNQPLPGSTRSWLPCVDRISERCTWDMEFIVPRKESGNTIPEYDGEGAFDEEDCMMVVCSGDLIEQVIHPTDTTKKIVHYSLSVPTPAPFIGFAVGPFEMIKLSPQQLQEEVLTAADLDENQQQTLMAEINMMCNIYAFGLPGFEEELNVTCSFLMHAMHFYTQEYGSYPFSDYKLVFVEDAWANVASSASLAICSSRLLHSADIIDQIYSTRRELSQELARQWFGIYIVQKSWPDTWLVRGLANYMGSLFIKRHLGNNEYRLRLKKDMELCCIMDINRPPIYNPALPYPLDPEDLEFIELKAPLVVYMLDKRMCKGGGTLGLSRVLPKILVSAMSGELAQNAISTHYFLRVCRKVSGFDTKVFAEQWIYRSGCPRFSFSFHFNRKKMVVEIFMRQENTNALIVSPDDMSYGTEYQQLMTPLFTGNLTVRIHEADGTPYEHILDIQANKQKFEVQFNTKYKRIRRNTKRFQAKQAAAAAAVAEEEQENEEGGDQTTVLGIIPSLGLGMPIFEDPSKKKEWRIVEWGQDEEDTSGAASAMFDWIRLDAEFEWVCVVEFKQPDYMWAAQLTKDRDVVAQHEAIDALKYMPSYATSTSLLRAIMDPKCFYKIRMEAAYGLASCAIPSLKWVGLHQLSKMFHQRFCFPINSQNDSNDQMNDFPLIHSIPKPNNFSNLSDYFLQKASVVAFSQIRDERGLTPVKIRQFLLDLLRYNDNIGNEFSDCYYVATLISALGDALIPASDEALKLDDIEGEQVNAAAKAEIERFRTLDYVIPTYHNIITVTCLKTMTKLMLKDLLPLNLSLFMQYTRYGNFLEVRLTAFDSLYILCGLSDPALNQYLLGIIKEDPSVYVSHYVARAMLAWLGLALKETYDVSAINKYTEEFAEEEGKVVIDDDRSLTHKTPQQEFQSSVENLRKRFENDTELQQSLWKLLNSSENAKIDHCIRKYLLQFSEYVFKPIDVGLKVTIRVPTLQPQDMGEDTSEPSTPTQQQPPIIRFSKPKPRTDEKSKKPSIHIRAEAPSQDTETTPSTKSGITVTLPSSVSSSTDHAERNVTIREEPKAAVSDAVSTPTPSPNIITLSISGQRKTEKQKAQSESTTQPPLQATASIPAPVSKPKHKKVVDSATAEELKKCRRVLNKINKYRCALPFVQPVDEVLDGAPNYYKIIKNPIDLSVIKRKVENKEYTTFRQFEDDIRLMLNNCYIYNSPGTLVYNEGQALEAVFEKEVASLRGKEQDETQNMTIVENPTPAKPQTIVHDTTPPVIKLKQPKPKQLSTFVSPAASTINEPEVVREVSKKTPSPIPLEPPQETIKPITLSLPSAPEKKAKPITDYEKMETIIVNAMTNPHAFEFLRPVDPIRQGVPHYFTIIKKPMDLGTIKGKLKNNQYASPEEMDEDVRLMFRNCYTFNPPNTYVYNEAKALEDDYNADWQKYFGNRRRPSASNAEAVTPTTATTTASPMTGVEPSSQKPSKPPKATPSGPEAAAVPVPKPKPPINPVMDANNKKKCERIIKKLWAHQASAAFHKPVDAVAEGVPHYYEVIKRPMDLSLIQRNFEQDKYKNIWDLERDVRQIFWNCYSFNHHESWVVGQCQALESFFNQIWSAEFADPYAIKGDDKRIAQNVVNKLTYHESAALFNEPVDLVALPDYAEIIKHPMDLRTIWERLESGKYTSLKAIDHDIRLVFKNCFTYNAQGTFAYDQGKRLEKYYQKISKDMRARISNSNGNSSHPSSVNKRSHSSLSSPGQEPPTKIVKTSNNTM
ncbi:hypothetical protein G6F70_005514 [Rhizopus microsporus]|nr:hypothetical protein G6F71_005357 [Rhizopus microsporus]KAG1198777.1 hypothetical protein G6F70_005514 [Rhizopus microsporus]